MEKSILRNYPSSLIKGWLRGLAMRGKSRLAVRVDFAALGNVAQLTLNLDETDIE